MLQITAQQANKCTRVLIAQQVCYRRLSSLTKSAGLRCTRLIRRISLPTMTPGELIFSKRRSLHSRLEAASSTRGAITPHESLKKQCWRQWRIYHMRGRRTAARVDARRKPRNPDRGFRGFFIFAYLTMPRRGIARWASPSAIRGIRYCLVPEPRWKCVPPCPFLARKSCQRNRRAAVEIENSLRWSSSAPKSKRGLYTVGFEGNFLFRFSGFCITESVMRI